MSRNNSYISVIKDTSQVLISPYVDKAKLLSSTQRSTAVCKVDFDSGLKIPLQLKFSSRPLPPHTPHSSSTAVEPHTLSHPPITESPPHTPAQSSTVSPPHTPAQSSTAVPSQVPAQS